MSVSVTDLTACLTALLCFSRALRFCAAVSFACPAGAPFSLFVPLACTSDVGAASVSFAMAADGRQPRDTSCSTLPVVQVIYNLEQCAVPALPFAPLHGLAQERV